MPVETAADRAVFVDPDEFGAAVTWTSAGGTVSFSAIFDAEYQLLVSPLDDAGVEGSVPMLMCRRADLPTDHAQDDSVTVVEPETEAVLAFTVVEIRPDGAGMVTVRLQESD